MADMGHPLPNEVKLRPGATSRRYKVTETKNEIQEEQNAKEQNSITQGVSMRGEYHQDKEERPIYKSSTASVYCKPTRVLLGTCLVWIADHLEGWSGVFQANLQTRLQ